MKKFRCMPLTLGLPLVFFAFSAIILAMMFDSTIIYVDSYGNPDPSGGFYANAFFLLLSLGFGVYCLLPAVRRIEIYSDHIVCKGLFPSNSIALDYTKCNVGMDWHIQNGNKIWWIYLCYGYPPSYAGKSHANRINAEKFRPGFIKIMYSEAVYQALVDVLPKKQKNMLTSARRFAGFEKQGRIIF